MASDQKSKLFTFRTGDKLLEKFDEVKRALGLSSSDAAREAMDIGLDAMRAQSQEEKDRREFSELDKMPRKALLSIVEKEKAATGLSRAEWRFIATYVKETYDFVHSKIEHIDRDLLIANMQAFADFIRLRDTQYPRYKSTAENYYFSNVGFSYVDQQEIGDDLQKHMKAVIDGLPEEPFTGAGVFPSRNLEVALRDEPIIDVVQLNKTLCRYLKPLLMVAIRGFWYRNDGQSIVGLDETNYSIIPLKNVKNGHFAINNFAKKGVISFSIEPLHHPYLFALNNYVEITDFSALLNRVNEECKHAKMPGFVLDIVDFALDSNNRRYMLASGRWRIFFSHAEFEALKSAINEFMSDPEVKKHFESLEMVYGKI